MSEFPDIPLEDNMDSMDESEAIMLMANRNVLQTGSEVATAGQWQEAFSKGLLRASHFRDYWRVTVPRVYKPELNRSCLEWAFDEEVATSLLLKPLELFICGEEPREALQRLAKMDKPPSVCGRVFKIGEPAYSCRECGMDNTCVLCVDCFKRSAHRNHKYKMGTSSGGGCCDCGDVEAWKSAPYCDTHIIGTMPQEASQGLSEDMSARTHETFSAVLGYCYQMLTLEHSPVLPNDLRLKDNEQDHLRILEQPDSYCTVLYNDETHTFEQVITTLIRVTKCSQRDATEYVTNIDREGRAVVKCSSFQVCSELKLEIEKFTSRHNNRSLKVLVVHTHVMAHQIYAMKLLQWMQSFVSHAEGFRRVLSAAALAPRPPEAPVAEGVLLRDCQLWKAARTAWHRLLIRGMLMDLDTKKALATVFTKNYGSVMKDFIGDDHDHAFSVSSLSVQIYTTPTLAHHLIAHEDALFILLNTFLSECSRKCNTEGKLEFERSASNMTFKRAQFILYDLKYLLSVKPEVWTDALRKGFLQGLSLILNLLTMMQGMDTVVRQVGQHMEYEPEWETAFNLHIKLATVVSLALEWCGSDKVVLVKAYRATLKKLQDNPPLANPAHPNKPTVVHELADHSATCILYDVSGLHVSIHLPLSRFLAGLHLHLHKFGLSFDSLEFQMPRPIPEQIIESVLRTQAMIAQVHAGLWRRNGYALLNQLYFYHNVKCRSEMLDRDIVLLQVGASLIESNEFLIHLLNKFNLINWANPDFEINSLKAPEEDSMRQTISLVEEFLGLCITVIGERHVSGVGEVTPEERTKKEIIQQLCVRPMSHSELNKTLPEDELHETGMENVIDEIAEFKKPLVGQGRGVYTLRPQFFSEYNVFFYHYTREDLSKSEEVQRKRKKAAGELECCPPPDLVKLAPSFTMLADLLQCDVMLHVMKTVLTRSADLRARSYSEMQLHKVLHLMGMALQEQASGRYPFLVFSERAARQGLPALLEELHKSPRVDAHKDLLTWTLNKYRSVAAMAQPKGETDEPASETSVSSSPSTASDAVSNTKDYDREWRSMMAAQKRAKIMAQIQAMQNSFMKENAVHFKESDSVKSSSKSESSTETAMEVTEPEEAAAAAVASTAAAAEPAERTCILCQEDTLVGFNSAPLVLAGFVQKSTVLQQNRSVTTTLPSSSTSGLYNPVIPSCLGPGVHVSTCGHVMHGQCWEKYFDNVTLRENRRPYRLRQPASFNIDKQEFLCPLCECLSNMALPLLPPLCTLRSPITPDPDPLPFHQWVACLRSAVSIKMRPKEHPCGEACVEPHCPVFLEATVAAIGTKSQYFEIFYTCPVNQFVQEMGEVGARFAALVPPDIPEFDNKYNYFMHRVYTAMRRATMGWNEVLTPGKGGPSPLGMVWEGAAYTLHSVEQLASAAGRPLLGHLSSRHADCLQALVRITALMGISQDAVSNHAVDLLIPLLSALRLPRHRRPSLLTWDCFSYCISLTMALPGILNHPPHQVSPVPIHPLNARYILNLILLVQIFKVMLTSDFAHCKSDVEMETESQEKVQGIKTLLSTLQTVRKNIDVSELDEECVWSVIQAGCQSYLRGSCLFIHFLMDREEPAYLTHMGGDTYENMCTYLELPTTFDGLFYHPDVLELLNMWAGHPEVESYLAGQNTTICIVREPRPPCKLVALPNDYSELINAVSLFVCPNNDREDSRNPTMCLVCGEMLCSQTYCCQMKLNEVHVGACTYHAHSCGAGAGVFLRVRECEVLLLAAPSKGCVVSPPYVDEYGETDQGLRRGNPLRLCKDTYDKLQMIWLSHRIHEEIARNIESNNNLMTTTWQHL